MNIRNFSIIAHIDHGKSTLADRILEKTGAISMREMKDRFLDTLELEQEKGITIKLQTARMNWQYTGDKSEFREKSFTLNLIDTPGHVDFNYEVSRSITASEGVILLVDATQGIQAQTISNFYKALERDLVIIPVISKIDLPQAQIEETKLAMIDIFGFNEDEILLASGKSGEGVTELLNMIVERVPPPSEKKERDPKLLIFNSFFHEHKGVIVLVKVVQGRIETGNKLLSLQTRTEIDPIEIGYLRPTLEKQSQLEEGEVGYIATGLKDIKKLHAGDTITIYSETAEQNVSPLSGYEPPKPMVYASLYPTISEEFEEFRVNLEKLALNDAALTYTKEKSPVLGSGYCCGFLGLLHLEITQERLSREFDTEVFTTSPSVLYKLQTNTKDPSKLEALSDPKFDEDGLLLVRTASEFPKQELIIQAYEPIVKLEVITPQKYIGPIIELVKERRGTYTTTEYLNPKSSVNISDYVILRFEIPTAEIIINFFDKLKSISSGYASMDYESLDYRKADIAKVTILVNHDVVEALSFISHKDSANKRAALLVARLVEFIPRQQFQVPVQAAIGGKIIARADIKAYRKNVIEKLYGGDVTRKKKLLEKQKKGKKRMKEFGTVEIPREAFLQALKSD
ncbi:MAG: translation elongation factor 4 [Candidatus Dojkabacteria bacterium]|nr:translation elongation factor 4 [Candidatus Dojkabacteria bacterium]